MIVDEKNAGHPPSPPGIHAAANMDAPLIRTASRDVPRLSLGQHSNVSTSLCRVPLISEGDYRPSPTVAIGNPRRGILVRRKDD